MHKVLISQRVTDTVELYKTFCYKLSDTKFKAVVEVASTVKTVISIVCDNILPMTVNLWSYIANII